MKKCFLFLVSFIFFFGISNNTPGWAKDRAVTPGKKPYTIHQTGETIRVDGKLDDAGWKEALVLELKYEVEPAENTPAPHKTELLMTYNTNYLYVGFRCFDPKPGEIRARVSDRDYDYGDDFVGILLDTFNDERKNFALWSNARGVQEDGIMSESGYNKSWDALYKSAGHIYDWGFAVEMAIPFSSLRFQRTNGPQIWGIDAWRLRPRNVPYLFALFPHDRNNSCHPCQMIKIKGFDGVKPGRNIEIAPTITAVRADSRDEMPGGDLEKSREEAEFGLTARWGLTPNLTLSGTLNPDFSQVEADAWQLNINQPFALFYQEKRPFFIEGSEYFKTGLNAVYTRTLRDPSWGAKLTGKEGKHSFGVYAVRDRLTNLIFPAGEGSDSLSMNEASLAAVLRYKLDIGSKATVGALFTHRGSFDEGEYLNRVYGADGFFRLTRSDTLETQVLGSGTRYPDAVAKEYNQQSGMFSDKAILVSYRHRSRNLLVDLDYRELGESFRADLGFIPQVDYRLYRGGIHYHWTSTNKWWTNFQAGVNAYQYKKQEDRGLLLKGIEAAFHFEGAMQSYATLSLKREREAYNGSEFDLGYGDLYLEFKPAAQLVMHLSSTIGDRVDYENIRAGKRFNITPGLSWFAGNHLRLNLNHTYESMKVGGETLYTADITQGSLIYQFNTRMFFRSILQYVDYKYNVENYLFEIDPQYKHLFMQLLFSYKLNPQTMVFLGYTDNYLGSREFRITRSNRAFFLKVGYVWQM